MAKDASSRTNAGSAFACIEVEVRDAERAERLAAEAYAAGATGLEERDGAAGTLLVLYAPAARAAAVRAAAAAVAAPEDRVGPISAVADVDWSEGWKWGLEAISVSSRLLVRPSFVAAQLAPGQQELVVDPGQAFGTGGHASTRLALEWIDAVAPGLAAGARVLDVGTGTGILALAALRLSDCTAVGLDLDPLAAAAARENALRNGLAQRLRLFTGPLAALRAEPFDLVVANLLRRELLPHVPDLAAHTRPGGFAIVSGLLAEEADAVAETLAGAGLGGARRRETRDAAGDRWVALLTTR